MWKVGTFAIVLSLSACTTEHVGEVSLQGGTDTECAGWKCGNNSPVVEFRAFHELSELGLPNAEGFRISAFVKAGINYDIHVTNGVLRGTRGALKIEHADLIGSEIVIEHESGSKYALRVDGVSPVHAWANVGGVAPTFESYLLSWTQWPASSGSQFTNLCPTAATQADALGMTSHYALVFEGDRIDAIGKRVVGIDPTWFNIGCAGHALAKLALSGHTHAGVFYGFATSPPERQTLLKLIVGDYCGTGQAFTTPGTPLTWKDAHGYTDHVLPPGTLEARWTSTGASCLGTLRASGIVDVEAKIEAACKMPPVCDDGNPTSLAGAYAVSANPK